MSGWASRTLVEIGDVTAEADAIVVVDVIVEVDAIVEVDVIAEVDVIVEEDEIVVAVADKLLVTVVVAVFGKNDRDFHGKPVWVHADAEAVDSLNDMVCDFRCCSCSGPHCRCNCSGSLFSVVFAGYVY